MGYGLWVGLQGRFTQKHQRESAKSAGHKLYSRAPRSKRKDLAFLAEDLRILCVKNNCVKNNFILHPSNRFA